MVIGNMSEKKDLPQKATPNRLSDELRETALRFQSYLEDAAKIKVSKIMERAGFTEIQAAMLHASQDKHALARDIIYPSVKKLSEYFPSWIENNLNKMDKGTRERCQKQMDLMVNLCYEYEKTDSNIDEGERKKKLERILDAAQTLLDYGNLPHDLVDKCVKEVVPDCTIL